MTSPALMTLGYGKRTIADVIALLARYDIKFLVDVRSAPYSRYHQDFSGERLVQHLRAHGIAYLYLGRELGGRPDDSACYDSEGRVDYAACRRRPEFAAGIARLRAAWHRGRRVALLCSEMRPEQCHRAKLIGPALVEAGMDVAHLDDDDTVLGQDEVMARLADPQPSLFDDPPSAAERSRRSYAPRET